MATHSSVLAWESLRQRSLVGYSPGGRRQSDTTEGPNNSSMDPIATAHSKPVFESVNIEVSPDALKLMIDYASGIPLTMQYIGDSVFWNTDNNQINQDKAIEGIILAGYEIGNKQLRRNLKKINNQVFNDILMKITEKELTNFNESSLQNILSDDEYTILPEFFKRMEEYEILESMNYTDEKTYNFKDKLTYSYFRIKSFENEQ